MDGPAAKPDPRRAAAGSPAAGPGAAGGALVESDLIEHVPVTPPSRRRRVIIGAIGVLVAGAMLVTAWPSQLRPVSPSPAAAADPSTVTIVAGEPTSIDPAKHGDTGSAYYVSQLYETLTAVDTDLEIRPALAESWTVAEDGTRITFTLRPNLKFSDGSALKASDVVHSWRRLFLPSEPSPLASLIADVKGARELLAGASSDTSTLGVSAPDDRTVVVALVRGGRDLPGIVSGAPFAVVPPATGDGEIHPTPGSLVGSGGYTLEAIDATSWTLKANPDYWAGTPAIDTVTMIKTLQGQNPVDLFRSRQVDVTQVGSLDASWIAWDDELGPSLRSDPSLAVTYYGFDTRQKPFDDVRVRRAFAAAVDWRRLAALDRPGTSVPATGLVPAGIPGRPDGDYLPAYDPAAAKTLLAQAGYANGAALGPISFVTDGRSYDTAMISMLEANLGVDIRYATMEFGPYQARLASDSPQIWTTQWVSDYPGSNDFLGMLLESGSTSNQGGWSSSAFDEAIAQATSASSDADATAAFADAMAIVRDEAPAVPVSYGTQFNLVREGLLGASTTGTGILRLAGLSWGAGR
jgi:oligopeptide transport system substrate-binding protein